MPKSERRALIGLHLLLAVYSLSDVCSKTAAGAPFMSFRFLFFYGCVLGLLGVYAIGWQQVIRRLPLTVAFANRAVTVVWGIVWGVLFFRALPDTPRRRFPFFLKEVFQSQRPYLPYAHKVWPELPLYH